MWHYVLQGIVINSLAPNDIYIYIYMYIYTRRTAQLTSRRCILSIYSTNMLTEYFRHAVYSPFFSLQDAFHFIMLSFFGSCNIYILNTECAKILKKIPAPKGQYLTFGLIKYIYSLPSDSKI